MAGLAGIVFAIYTGSDYPLASVGSERTAIATGVIGGLLLLFIVLQKVLPAPLRTGRRDRPSWGRGP